MLLAIVRYREYYCIIKRNDSIPGLGSHIITNLGQIITSISEGYIPIIDMINVENSFSGLSQKMKKNAWELFFKQPFNCSLSPDILEKRYIVKDGIPRVMPSYDMEFLTNPDLVQRWKSLMKKFIPFSSEIEKKNTLAFQHFPFNTNERILGVLARGTDYTLLRPYNHPVQPTITQLLDKAEKVIEKYQCKYVYLATEDSLILSAFQKKFKDLLISTQNIYFSNIKEENLTEVYKKYQVDLYSKNQEYLTALYLLSKCCCFIGGRTSGAVVSLLLSDKYDYFYMWNMGRYGVDDIFSRLIV